MTEKTEYKYFGRDMSWLSFNYRVLLEAADETLPIYDRIRFLSIYSSNTEEFFEIRVAEHRDALHSADITDNEAARIHRMLNEITAEVNRQQEEFYNIFYDSILPALQQSGMRFYCDRHPIPYDSETVKNYFDEYIFPFLAPVSLLDGIRVFLRDRRLYLAILLRHRATSQSHYVMLKLLFDKAPRFIRFELDEKPDLYMFIEDVIRSNLASVFPGYKVEACHSIKISRDADIRVDEIQTENIPAEIRKRVVKRKVGGEIIRFMYDRDMPDAMVDFFCRRFDIGADKLVKGGWHMNLQDISKLLDTEIKPVALLPQPMRVPFLDEAGSVVRAVERRDVLLHFPYQSFDYLIRFLEEAAADPDVEEIKITQYRVAENSAVVGTLMDAARKYGKRVTVFVEVKARFDEEHNLNTADAMKAAGIRIIYSIKGLKVHAKVAVILRNKPDKPDFAYVGTGNFNEKTATIYSDIALLTCNKAIVTDINNLFAFLEKPVTHPDFHFQHLLVTRFSMVDALKEMIQREVENVKAGRKGRIILKMNGLQDETMIDELYRASENGVSIDLIVRGICCLVPGQPYSRNIRVTRIVDMFLEHARIWYFYNDGDETIYISSADWMKRNLNRRIEAAAPILDSELKEVIINILHIQLSDNVKACYIDENLQNVFKRGGDSSIRAQTATADYIRAKFGAPTAEGRDCGSAIPEDRGC
ncbi:MAG: polyphosphate kinase 1 [Tannerella sp.]|jgi:polyphosphate kinase|nr:polyphosphate kinase 1 [Tannerella sp.]